MISVVRCRRLVPKHWCTLDNYDGNGAKPGSPRLSFRRFSAWPSEKGRRSTCVDLQGTSRGRGSADAVNGSSPASVWPTCAQSFASSLHRYGMTVDGRSSVGPLVDLGRFQTIDRLTTAVWVFPPVTFLPYPTGYSTWGPLNEFLKGLWSSTNHEISNLMNTLLCFWFIGSHPRSSMWPAKWPIPSKPEVKLQDNQNAAVSTNPSTGCQRNILKLPDARNSTNPSSLAPNLDPALDPG